MAATLTVSQIRNALYLQQPGGSSGTGRSSTAALGTMFHQVLAGILTDQAPCSLQVVLRDHDPDKAEWKVALKSRVYDQLVGPLLTQQYAALNGQGRQVLDLWVAVQEACDYLVELWWTIILGGKKSEDQGQWFDPERPISREFHRPGWTSPVAVVGQLDAVLRIPNTSHSCLLEWKLGQTSPELDLAQACLYQMLLEGELGPQHHLALAVVGFHPQRHDRLFKGPELEAVRETLLNLIGDLAGVTGREKTIELQPVNPKPTPASGVPMNTLPITKPVPTGPPGFHQDKWVIETTATLLKALREHQAPCRSVQPPAFGPSFVRFFVFPEKRITTKKVTSQAENLKLHLRLNVHPEIEVVDGMIAIDLPRLDRESVTFSDVLNQMESLEAQREGTRVPIGVDLNGEWHWCDLVDTESPHMLVVGTTGSGKSEWLRTAVATLMKTNTPETLELVLIDPKQMTFKFAKDTPYLSEPIVVPGKLDVDVTEILGKLVERMMRRYDDLEATNCKSLSKHALATGTPQRRVVIVCDEYSKMLSSCENAAEKRLLEKHLVSIAAVGRAAGFHLILATQHPSREILTSNIKNNLPAKVVLRVGSSIASNVAMGESGAERLLGNGDLYYKCIGGKQRYQGPWLPTEEEDLVGASLVSSL